MKIPSEVLDVLRERSVCEGTLLRLGGDRLNPGLYKRTNEVLEGAGGRWDKRRKAHVFASDAATAIQHLLAAREVTTVREKTQSQQYFPTPPAVVARLLDLADLREGMEVLEPSAGQGAIVSALAKRKCLVDAVEREAEHAQVLKETGDARKVTVTDFLTVPAEPRYDRVVMNPPFTRQADIAHVRHALGFLRPDGLLVAVMSQATDSHRGAASFRTLVAERGGTLNRLPDGSFKESGTGVATLIAVIPACVAGHSTSIEDQASPPPDLGENVEDLASPMVILQELKRTQRSILRELSAMERLLEQAPARTSAEPEQLTFDLDDQEVTK